MAPSVVELSVGIDCLQRQVQRKHLAPGRMGKALVGTAWQQRRPPGQRRDKSLGWGWGEMGRQGQGEKSRDPGQSTREDIRFPS